MKHGQSSRSRVTIGDSRRSSTSRSQGSSAVEVSGGDAVQLYVGVVCLLAFCFVMFSQKLPLGEVSAAGALLVALMRRGGYAVPVFFRWYLLYLAMGAIGLFSTRYPAVVSAELINVAKFTVIGFAVCNVIVSPGSARLFVIGYLTLFALFPVRGSIYNYINGYTEAGRIAWNFFFRNPNDLAMACFLPLGLCGYLIFTDKSKWIRKLSWTGIAVLVGVQMLTQSRGAMLALGIGLLYFIFYTKQRIRTFIGATFLVVLAAVLTPSAVWDRVAGLTKVSTGDMSQVDPEGSASGRLTLMSLALGIAKDNPVLGVGFGAYAYENARVAEGNLAIGKDERGMRDAHSTYIRAAAETGYIGAAGIVLSIVASLMFCRCCRKHLTKKQNGQLQAMAILALEASMVAYAVGAVVNSAERSTYFMLQFAVPWALAAVLFHSLTKFVMNNEVRSPVDQRPYPKL